MTTGTIVGICDSCGAKVVVVDRHNATCPCGRSTVYLGAPGQFSPPKLRLIKGDG
jgi:hypothetical protein